MYDISTDITDINILRKILFCGGDRPISTIPPTKACLVEHIKRAAFQAGQVWGRALTGEKNPSPENWGWVLSDKKWIPKWSSVCPVWSELRDLERCGCKKMCESMRCSCRRLQLPCTPACSNCRGECHNASH